MNSTTFDTILFIICLGSGVMSVLMPEKTWHMLQSKKMKSQMEYTEKTEKLMRLSGIILVAVSIFFGLTLFGVIGPK